MQIHTETVKLVMMFVIMVFVILIADQLGALTS